MSNVLEKGDAFAPSREAQMEESHQARDCIGESEPPMSSNDEFHLVFDREGHEMLQVGISSERKLKVSRYMQSVGIFVLTYPM